MVGAMSRVGGETSMAARNAGGMLKTIATRRYRRYWNVIVMALYVVGCWYAMADM